MTIERTSSNVSGLYIEVQIKYHQYNNGNLCCMLWNVKNNEPFGIVTKNIHDLNSTYRAYVDLNNFGKSVLYFLEDNGIATSTGSCILQSWCYYPLYEFNLDMKDKVFYFVYE